MSGDGAAAREAPAGRATEGPPTLAGARVLVVGDQVVVALDLARTLRGLGCAVLGPASEPAHALALLRQERPDAVLLDLGAGPFRLWPAGGDGRRLSAGLHEVDRPAL